MGHTLKLRLTIPIICIACIILAVGAFHLATMRAGQRWGDDFGLYLLHAENIAQGRRYEDTGFIYNRFFPTLSPRTYPPVWPLLLAPVYRWHGLDLEAMKVELTLFFLASLLMVFLTFRDELPVAYVAAMIAMIGFNPYFWDFKENVLSDIPFLFFVLLSLFVINKAYRTSGRAGPSSVYIPLAAGAIYLAYGTRGPGVVLVASLILFDLIKLRRPSAFALITTALVIGTMALQHVLVPGGESYLDQLPVRPKIVGDNVVQYTRAFASIWYDSSVKGVHIALFAVASTLALAGFVRRVRHGASLFELFTILYTALIVTWPASQERYLIPLMPLYLFYAFTGVEGIRVWKGAARRTAFVTLTAAAVFSYATRYATEDFGAFPEGIAREETADLFAHVRQAARGEDVFIFQKPRALALFTGSQATANHMPESDDVLWGYFEEIRATHVIVTRIFRRPKEIGEGTREAYLQSFVARHQGRFRETFANADFTVYQINQPPR